MLIYVRIHMIKPGTVCDCASICRMHFIEYPVRAAMFLWENAITRLQRYILPILMLWLTFRSAVKVQDVHGNIYCSQSISKYYFIRFNNVIYLSAHVKQQYPVPICYYVFEVHQYYQKEKQHHNF